ncbi:MAG: hypothetical protein V4726_00860 [Verrucomicrobiota bacterium]
MTLTQVQQAVVRYLSDDPFFRGTGAEKEIPVIAGNDKSLESRVKTGMGRFGICVIVYPLGGDFGAHSASTPYLSPGRYNCRVRENITLNRGSGGSGQPADYVAEVCALLLQHHKPTAEDGKALGGGGIVLKSIAADEDEPGISAWNLVWEYAAGVSHDPVRLNFASGTASPPPP